MGPYRPPAVTPCYTERKSLRSSCRTPRALSPPPTHRPAPAGSSSGSRACCWFRTGDLGQFDRAGKKFFPREIEEILSTHPKILHAAIVGVPDPRLSERNCLCVIPRPGHTLTLDEVVGYLRDGVATYKLPETIEVFDEMPFTPTGKIQRHVLVRRVLERRGA